MSRSIRGEIEMGLYLDESWRLKGYTAATRNGKSTVRIEIETGDHFALGYFLDSLARIEDKQRAERKSSAKPTLLALPAPKGR